MKILVVRFSSIGDIVLTSAVVRCIKQQVKNCELHFITKTAFKTTVASNPYIDKVYSIDKKVNEVISDLKQEKYDYIIDLHNNLRTKELKFKLGVRTFKFDKLNFKKFLFVKFKVNKMPDLHIVDRYFKAVKSIGVVNDGKGLDYFIPEKDKLSLESLAINYQNGFNALVVGGSFFTKQIPVNKLVEFCKASSLPIVLLGGKGDEEIANKVISLINKEKISVEVMNACGKYNLNQSASLLQLANKVISSDTGLMHIAAAFKKDIISVWGNTVPEFGMTPYLPGANSKILEVKNLSCRPCSKLGYKACPKGHFKCMNEIVIEKF